MDKALGGLIGFVLMLAIMLAGTFSTLGIVIGIGLVLAIVLVGSFSHYRKKEQTEMRELDLHIFALENGAEFIKGGSEVKSILTDSDIAYGRFGTVRNVIQWQNIGYRAAIFDYFYEYGERDRSEQLTGIAVYIDQIELPPFKITQNVFTGGVALSNYPRIHPNRIPYQLKQAISVFAPEESQDFVCDLLKDNLKAQETVTEWNFRGLFCNGPRAVLYLHRQYEATEYEFEKMTRYIDDLISFFGEGALNGGEWNNHIELLKKQQINH